MFNPYEMIQNATKIPPSLVRELNHNDLTQVKGSTNRRPLNDAYIDNRLRSDKPITFLSFIDDLRSLWEAAGKTGKIIRNLPMKEESEFPAITYNINRRILSPDFKDIKPRLRTTILHPYIDGEYVELYGQMFDVWVEFGVHSLRAEEADEMVMELEEFLQTYTGFFKSKGVQEILFFSQGPDEVLNKGRFNVARRKLQYTMRFEKITVKFLNEIQDIATRARIKDENEIV